MSVVYPAQLRNEGQLYSRSMYWENKKTTYLSYLYTGDNYFQNLDLTSMYIKTENEPRLGWTLRTTERTERCMPKSRMLTQVCQSDIVD